MTTDSHGFRGLASTIVGALISVALASCTALAPSEQLGAGSPDLMVASPSVSDSGLERRRWGVGVDDAAVLPIAGRGDHDCGTCGFGYQQPSGEPDRAVDCRCVLLRCVRGRGCG